MSGPDRIAEASYANLAREFTGLPLVGMTLATGDTTWSARHWNRGVGQDVDCTHATNIRVVGDQLAVSWNDTLVSPPMTTHRQIRTVSAWGDRCQADLARRRILVVGAGSVGLDGGIAIEPQTRTTACASSAGSTIAPTRPPDGSTEDPSRGCHDSGALRAPGIEPTSEEDL